MNEWKAESGGGGGGDGGEWMGHHVEGETIYIGKMPRHTVKFMDGWLFIAYSSQEMAAGLAFSTAAAVRRRAASVATLK